jgi:acyl-CoA thioesterase FadM
VYSATTHLGTKSFTMHHRLLVDARRNEAGELLPIAPVLVAKAVAVLVAYDPVAQVSIPLPHTLADRIRAWDFPE